MGTKNVPGYIPFLGNLGWEYRARMYIRAMTKKIFWSKISILQEYKDGWR